MNKTGMTALLGSGLILLAATVGCKSHDKPPMDTPPASAAPSVAEINSAKFQNATVPQAVQTAFQKDHPTAAIDTIKLRTTSSGLEFYEIRYIQDGTGGVSSYQATGAKLP